MNKHSHYFKDVSQLKTVDVYRVLKLFNVTDPCLQHAIKKLLVAGGRNAVKNVECDIREAIDSLNRALEMSAEDKDKTSTLVGSTNAIDLRDLAASIVNVRMMVETVTGGSIEGLVATQQVLDWMKANSEVEFVTAGSDIYTPRFCGLHVLSSGRP